MLFIRIIIIILIIFINSSAFAGNITLQEIQELENQIAANPVDPNIVTKDHWIYNIFKTLSIKYNLSNTKEFQQINLNQPVTKTQAAEILNIILEKVNSFNEADQARIDILTQELQEELSTLEEKISACENQSSLLKGKISNLISSNNNSLSAFSSFNPTINGGTQLRFARNIKHEDEESYSNFHIPYSYLFFKGKIHPHINYGMFTLYTTRFDDKGKGILVDTYISTDIIPYHEVYLGQLQIPFGKDGWTSPFALDANIKPQISRNLHDIVDHGIRISGTWDLIDYHLGIFNGNTVRNMAETNKDLTYSSWIVLKPLYKNPELGKLELGTGYFTGRTDSLNRNVFDFYAGYNYKKYGIRGEYSFTDSYEKENQNANGFYVLNSYNIKDKLQLIARYDRFYPNSHNSKTALTEYTIGGNYFFKENIKLMLNLIHKNSLTEKDSQRALLITQFTF